MIFNSISDAVKWLRDSNIAINATTSNITKACNGERKSAYKLHWQRLD